jgi:DNA-binding transcriptional LysR family regulator
VLSPVPLDDLAAFAHVAETLSFTAAAQRLGVPKSTLSRAVARLEDTIGTRLLQRTTRSIALTEAGRRLSAQSAPHVTALEGAIRSLDDTEGEPRGVLRLTAPPDTADIFLGEMLAQFVARYQRIEIDIDLSTRQVDLVKEGFDVALRAAISLTDQSLVARKLVETELQLYAAPAYLARRGAPRTFADLAEHDRVSFVSGRARPQWPIHDEETVCTMLAGGRLRTDDFSFLRALLRAGSGIGTLPSFVAAPDVGAGRLVRVLPDWSNEAGSIFLVYPSARNLSRNVAAFRDFAVSWFRGRGYAGLGP